MRHALFAAPLLLLLACSPAPTESEGISIETVKMSMNARQEMDRVNAARLATELPATLPAEPDPGDYPAQPAVSADPAPAGSTPTAATPAETVSYDAGLVRIQVLLDRAHFSPGVIDGYDGENVRKAVSAYQQTLGLPVNGRADDALLTRLEQTDDAPAMVAYVITQEDVAGPFVDVPQDLEAMSRLERVGYESAIEGIAEKFHMDDDLLRTLNPGADFTRAGAEIVVANAGGGLDTSVASISVDKRSGAVIAYDASNNLLAYYPATIGSAEAPAPSGEHSVRAIAFDPTYHYNPERLPTFGQRNHGALDIAAGPNNPVGAVWIALSIETYGIHGAPEPSRVSKTASHGCIRLTNWDAVELGRAVRAGVPVNFRNGVTLAARNETASQPG